MAKRKNKPAKEEEVVVPVVETEVVETPEVVEPAKEEVVVEPTPEPVKEEVKEPEPVKKPVVAEETKTPTKPVVLNLDEIISSEDSRAKGKHACIMLENFLEADKKHLISGNKTSMVSSRFSLYKDIVSIINNADYGIFKGNMDVLSRALAVSDPRVSEVKLMSYDYLWTFGSTSKLAYQLLVKVITMLANPSTRAEKLKAVSVGGVFKYLDQTGISNLSRYYDL